MIKKCICLGIAFILILGSLGCNQSNTSTLEKENIELKARISVLEETLESANIEIPQGNTVDIVVVNSTQNKNFSEIVVKVTDKINKKGSYSEFIVMPFKVINNYNKDVKGIEGIMHIKDMFGKKIMDMSWDITKGTIPSGGYIEVNDTGLDFNHFMDDHQKIYVTAYKDLIFEYEVSSVLFTDGTSIK